MESLRAVQHRQNPYGFTRDMIDNTESTDDKLSGRFILKFRNHSPGSREALKPISSFENSLNLCVSVDLSIVGNVGVDTVQVRNRRLGPNDRCHLLNLRLTSSWEMTRPSSAAAIPRAIFMRT